MSTHGGILFISQEIIRETQEFITRFGIFSFFENDEQMIFRGCLFLLLLSSIHISFGQSDRNSSCDGWNTWNNSSVLSHVYLPSGLNIQLLLRKKRRGPYWLKDAYIASPKYNFKEQIEPKEHAYDGSYTHLHLSWEGMSATIETASNGEVFVLKYEPDPEQSEVHSLVFDVGFLWNKRGQIQQQSNYLVASWPDNLMEIRSHGDHTDVHLPLNSPHLTFDSDKPVYIYTGSEKSNRALDSLLTANRVALQEEAAKYKGLKEVYLAMQSVVAWNQFYDPFNDRCIASVSRIWNDAWGGYIIFDWDTYFIGLMASMGNASLAKANLTAITEAISESGFIPNVASTYLKSEDRSQPPVGSLCTKWVYELTGDQMLLEDLFEPLLRWNRWWSENRDNQGYLSWGSDPHPEGMSPFTKQAAKWESGLDNSPMFDEAEFDTTTHMLNLASVGLMSMYIADCKALIEIARILKQADRIVEIQDRAKKYSAALQTLWDEDLGIFRDKNLTTGQYTNHKSPTHFYPLLAKEATSNQANRMVEEHLMNPKSFYGEYMIPSISRDNPAYTDNSYWRGRIWAPMNFLVYVGLRNYDLPKAQAMLAEKSVELLLKSWNTKKRIHENYNSETGVGDDVRNSDPFYAWGGLLGLIGMIEEGYFPLSTMEK